MKVAFRFPSVPLRSPWFPYIPTRFLLTGSVSEESPRTVSLLANKFVEQRRIWIGLFCVAAILVVAWVTVVFRDLPGSRFSVTAGTNVAWVSVEVTHGTSHTFYYRGKALWEWNEVCKRFGWRALVDCKKHQSRTYESADMLWVTCRHVGETLEPRLFRVMEVTAEGRKTIYSGTDVVRDKKRGVTVSRLPLRGGMDSHRGSVIYIKYGTKELAKIDVR